MYIDAFILDALLNDILSLNIWNGPLPRKQLWLRFFWFSYISYLLLIMLYLVMEKVPLKFSSMY